MITAIKPPNFKIAEPAISENALRIHYEQHYLKYVENAQKLTSVAPWQDATAETIIKVADMQRPLYNNVAQVYNHELFFEQFTANPTKIEDCGLVYEHINDLYPYASSSIKRFKDEIIEKSLSLFGSGYLWVFKDKSKNLEIKCFPNAYNPLKDLNKVKIILCIDLWEHSYYLDYQSDRKQYIKNVLDYIDWKVVEERLSK